MKTKLFHTTIRKTAGDRQFAFVLSTPAIDRENDMLNQRGWQLDHYRRNPVVLWAHNYEQPPIARATSIFSDGSALRATVEFPPMGLYPFADQIHDLVKSGFINATSVGFKPIEFDYNPSRGGTDFSKQELLEFSIVPIPSNPQSLITMRAPSNRAAITKWFQHRKESHMRSDLVLFVKDGDGDDEEEMVEDDETTDKFSSCPLADQCPNPDSSLNCAKGSDCPFKLEADPDGPAGKRYTPRQAIMLQRKRDESRRHQDKLIELLKWERQKRIEHIRKGGGQVRLTRRQELQPYLGTDCDWPADAPIVSLGIS